MAGERKRLTKAQRRALEWVAARQPVHLFDASAPALWFVRRLKKAGLLETGSAIVRGAPLPFVSYRVSPAGRRALVEDGGGND